MAEPHIPTVAPTSAHDAAAIIDAVERLHRIDHRHLLTEENADGDEAPSVLVVPRGMTVVDTRPFVDALPRRPLEAPRVIADAHEAYVGDASAPLKAAMRSFASGAVPGATVSPYDRVEDLAQRAVAARFGLAASVLHDPAIRRVDRALAEREREVFFGTSGPRAHRDVIVEPARCTPIGTTSQIARTMWAARLVELLRARHGLQKAPLDDVHPVLVVCGKPSRRPRTARSGSR